MPWGVGLSVFQGLRGRGVFRGVVELGVHRFTMRISALLLLGIMFHFSYNLIRARGCRGRG